MKTVSIGIMRDDGDFAILATLNNNDEHMSAEFFDQLVRGLTATLSRELGEDVQSIERQDTPDYVCLDCPTCMSCGDDIADYEDGYCVYCHPAQFETEGEEA